MEMRPAGRHFFSRDLELGQDVLLISDPGDE